jgi:hypothetical protein
MPGHSVAQIIQPNLLTPHTLPHPRDANLCLASISKRNSNHHLAPAPRSSSGINLNSIILIIALEKFRAMSGWWRGLHLQREPGARVHGIALAEGIWDLFDIDRIKRNPDPDAPTLAWIVDEDELALLRIGDIAKKASAVLVVERASVPAVRVGV